MTLLPARHTASRGPIEDGLLRHPVVRMAAVVGTPDRQRTGTVTAFVMLNGSYAA
jgi:acetyl-CoA synthetase